MQLDIIIPVYKDLEGLKRTLFSIGTEVHNDIYVTIVDDCSHESYENIINTFLPFFPIRVLMLDKNVGPGMARQYGINHTNSPYLTFIDCGDTFTTPVTINKIIVNIKNNPNIYLFSYGHLTEYDIDNYEIVEANHNRIHGKIYKREFLNQYTIQFNSAGSRANEDIGFNMACRLLAQHDGNINNINRILECSDNAVIWKSIGPSITRNNNCEFFYREQNIGLAINIGKVIELGRKHHVDEHHLLEITYDFISSLFLFYICTLNCRPEYTDIALMGCSLFYHKYFKSFTTHNPELLLQYYYQNLLNFLKDEESPIKQKFNSLNLIEFLDYLEQIPVDNKIIKSIMQIDFE